MNRQTSSKNCKKWQKFAKTSHFSVNFITFGAKIAQNVIKNFKNLLRFAYRPDDNNKRGFSAKGLSLLPLALRPRLFGVSILIILISALLYIVNIPVSNVSAASITLTIPKTLTLNVNPVANNGFAKSETPGKITVATDNSVGYTLSIKAKNESNDLLNGNNKIVSISNNLSEDNFKNSEQSNIWGFLPSKLYNTESQTSQDNSDFIPGPKNDKDTTIDVTDSSNTEPNSYNISLGAKVDSTIPSGSYSNTFIISATTNELPYEKMQNWEGCDSLGDEQTITLIDSRDNKHYTVAKLKDGKCWMTQNLALGKDGTMTLTSSDSDVSSDYTLPASSPSGFSDDSAQNIYVTPAPDDNYYGGYYTWLAATAGTNPSSGEASSSICPKGWRLPTNAEFSALTKSYDSTTAQQAPANFVLAGYYDSSSPHVQGTRGFWWSSTAVSSGTKAYHLRLWPDFSSFFTDNHYKRYGSSIRCVSRSTDPIGNMQDVGIWGAFVEKGQSVQAVDTRDNKTYTVARLEDGKLWMTQNLGIGSNDRATSLDPDNTDISQLYTLPQGSTTGFSDNSAQNIYITPTPDNNRYGGYYTYAAATAGTNPSSGESSSSICPKGWRLPTKAEFDTLVNSYNITSIQQAPANFVLAGYYSNSSPILQGTGSLWWSSTAGDSTNAYYLYLWPDYSSFVIPNNLKRYGGSIRCISEFDFPAENMQDMAGMDTDGFPEDLVVNVFDARDGNIYRIAKLKDGNVWMVDNLRLGNTATMTLTPENTDINSIYELPASRIDGFGALSGDQNIYIDTTSNNSGGYYTWAAATAGSGLSSYEDAPNSICPKGWRLPDRVEFNILTNNYTFETIQQLPANFELEGFNHYNSVEGLNWVGRWWSSSPSRQNYFSYLELALVQPPVFHVGTEFGGYGYSLRCILR